MSKVLVAESNLTAIADAIRAKLGVSTQYTPAQMAAAILSISGINDDVINFSQVNSTAAAYLAASGYESDPGYTKEVISSYQDDSDITLEKPAGYVLNITNAGTIYFVDESTGDCWNDTVTTGQYMVYNLTPGHVWKWFVLDNNGKTAQTGRLSPTGSLRMIYLQYPHNFRDIGGWVCDGGSVRYGLLYRGAQLSYNNGMIATETDIQRLRRLGIRCEIDLRTLEQTAGRDGVVGTDDDLSCSVLGNDVYYIKYPFSDASYVDIVRLSGSYAEQTAALMRRIVDNAIHGIPTYFHCQAGADRTGTIAYLIEGVLGVSQADMDRDFELTSFYPTYERTRLNTNWRSLVSYINGLSGSTLRDKFVQWYLDIGIPLDDINAFRTAMIDGTPEVLDDGDYTISYSVTNNLPAGVVNSNTAKTVLRGASYQSTITADIAKDIAIGSVTVRMGGVDITEDVLTLTPYTPTTDYTIVNNLTHVINGNPATAIAGGSYNATLTAESGYTLNTVNITMGGVDITSTVYESGVINIPNVTGNIVITATATEAVKTNMLPQAVDTDGTPYNGGTGYKANTRLSSSGTESTANGYFATGFIPCVKGQTVTFENLELPATNYSGYNMCYIAVYDSSKTCIKSSYSKDVFATTQNNGTKDANDHILSIQMNKGVGVELDSMAYFRISAIKIDGTSKIYVE